MTVTLRPPISPRERILAFGVAGTGKSSAILEVARRCPTDTFYVADTDFGSYERLLATQFVDVENVRVTGCVDWEDFTQFVKTTNAEMERDDWLVVDIMTATWDAVQGYFVNQVFGEGIDEFFIGRRKALQDARETAKNAKAKAPSFSAISGEDGDWQVINKLYFKFYNDLLRCPGHIYMTAEQDQVQTGKWGDETSVVDAFGPYGFKPKGQKKLTHIPHTNVWLRHNTKGWTMTTIGKDRGRELVEDRELGNFAIDYLCKVAGWKPKKL